MKMTTAEYKHAWYVKNKVRLLEKARLWRADHQTQILEYRQQISPERSAKYRETNKTKHLQATRDWRTRNKEHLQSYARQYAATRRNDVQARLASRLRKRIGTAIRVGQKGGSAVRDLGCSIDELKVHLERQFRPGMTWDNWSRTGWHIDHIRPLISFDLTDRTQFLAAANYLNLQPLWASDNIRKGSKTYETT